MQREPLGATRARAILAVMIAIAALTGVRADDARADAWSDRYCKGGSSAQSYWKRSHAIEYAQPPVREGYLLNGGCYRLNDRDDTPTFDASGGGEGTDCSGFVFRVWALRQDGAQGYRRWDYDKYIHGPYYSWDFKDPLPEEPFRNISKEVLSTTVMDAIAWYRDGGADRHIAIIWQEGTRSDYFIHAHNNTVGVEISEEIYRQQPDVEAVQRKLWSLECEPKCPTPGTLVSRAPDRGDRRPR